MFQHRQGQRHWFIRRFSWKRETKIQLGALSTSSFSYKVAIFKNLTIYSDHIEYILTNQWSSWHLFACLKQRNVWSSKQDDENHVWIQLWTSSLSEILVSKIFEFYCKVRYSFRLKKDPFFKWHHNLYSDCSNPKRSFQCDVRNKRQKTGCKLKLN